MSNEKASEPSLLSRKDLDNPWETNVLLPGMQIPTFRSQVAIDRGVGNRVCFRVWGGLGDQICSEPTLRYALKTFKGCEIFLATDKPELFEHLKFSAVFDLRKGQPDWVNLLTLDTMREPSDLTWEFASHMLVNCVDFASICSMRSMLPVEDKIVQLKPPKPRGAIHDLIFEKNLVYVHPGLTWQSRTAPKWWWDRVLVKLISAGLLPVLIGAKPAGKQTTVDVNALGCADLRGTTSLMETVWLLQHAKVLLTNDSAPIHMAATGNAWIGFLSTCKHPDFVMHWRRDERGAASWCYRMKDLSLGGAYQLYDICPNKVEAVEAEDVGEHLENWLPEPESFAQWAIEKYDRD